MKLLALGVDHRSAPAAVREAIAFDATKYANALGLLAREFPGNEFVIISTCNRVELYVAGSPEQVPELDALTETLVQLHGVGSETFSKHLVSYRDDGVVGHLFRVAASLESLVLGEGQILGQVREAYRTAVECQTVGPAFHTLFQTALRVGKLVRERTGMDQGKLSVASVAVDVAKGVFDSFADKTVLVIGAGKMGELTLQHLKGLKPGRILVTNRDPAARRRPQSAGMARPWRSSSSSRRSSMPTWSSAPRPLPSRSFRWNNTRRCSGAAKPAFADPGHRVSARFRPADRRAGTGDALPH